MASEERSSAMAPSDEEGDSSSSHGSGESSSGNGSERVERRKRFKRQIDVNPKRVQQVAEAGAERLRVSIEKGVEGSRAEYPPGSREAFLDLLPGPTFNGDWTKEDERRMKSEVERTSRFRDILSFREGTMGAWKTFYRFAGRLVTDVIGLSTGVVHDGQKSWPDTFARPLQTYLCLPFMQGNVMRLRLALQWAAICRDDDRRKHYLNGCEQDVFLRMLSEVMDRQDGTMSPAALRRVALRLCLNKFGAYGDEEPQWSALLSNIEAHFYPLNTNDKAPAMDTSPPDTYKVNTSDLKGVILAVDKLRTFSFALHHHSDTVKETLGLMKTVSDWPLREDVETATKAVLLSDERQKRMQDQAAGDSPRYVGPRESDSTSDDHAWLPSRGLESGIKEVSDDQLDDWLEEATGATQASVSAWKWLYTKEKREAKRAMKLTAHKKTGPGPSSARSRNHSKGKTDKKGKGRADTGQDPDDQGPTSASASRQATTKETKKRSHKSPAPADEPTAKRQRGRPRKEKVIQPTEKRRPGRPRKDVAVTTHTARVHDSESQDSAEQAATTEKRRRVRPQKDVTVTAHTAEVRDSEAQDSAEVSDSGSHVAWPITPVRNRPRDRPTPGPRARGHLLGLDEIFDDVGMQFGDSPNRDSPIVSEQGNVGPDFMAIDSDPQDSVGALNDDGVIIQGDDPPEQAAGTVEEAMAPLGTDPPRRRRKRITDAMRFDRMRAIPVLRQEHATLDDEEAGPSTDDEPKVQMKQTKFAVIHPAGSLVESILTLGVPLASRFMFGSIYGGTGGQVLLDEAREGSSEEFCSRSNWVAVSSDVASRTEQRTSSLL
ncbi:hypothetical protein N0V82_005941 [Gnomoniopsis sp. IMI 355080]|nr:hypothetical protein N0V82_005941 [Gnomoniopsis sp. IMI 355080]